MKLKSKFKRRLYSLKECFINKEIFKSYLKGLVADFYALSQKERYNIPKVSKKRFIDDTQPIFLPLIKPVEGNLKEQELLILAHLVKTLNPYEILEIGTFNGLGTLILALNAPARARIDTVDLIGCEKNRLPFWPEDLKYIENKEKLLKIYRDYKEKNKIEEHLFDTTTRDFSIFKEKELIFIDGGHSFDVVKNDTEKALKILKSPGVILWHDYCANCPGVFEYLNELSQKLPLFHIENTSFVLFFKA